MEKILFEDVLDIAEYEKIRRDFRRRVMALKEFRRVSVGGHVTLLFENRDTVLLQIQEMMRIERMVREAAIRHEIDTYNELIPARNELVATMFIEVDDPQHAGMVLESLRGLDGKSVFVETGEERIEAAFDSAQEGEGCISAVRYLRFGFSDAQAASFRNVLVPAALVMDHPNYRHRTILDGDTRRQLAGDLEI